MKIESSFICGRDTEEVTTPTDYQGTQPYLSHDSSRRVSAIGDVKNYKYIIDPNIKAGQRILTLSKLLRTNKEIYEELGLENPITSRIDICFDDYEHEYRDLLRITMLLFILIEKHQGIKNDYFSHGLTSAEPKTIRFQNSSWEAEFYNKALQEPRLGVKCRLELRKKRLKTMKEEGKELRVIEQWLAMLDKATAISTKEYDAILYEINDFIMTSYEHDVRRGEYRRKDYNCLIQRYHSYIFSGRQLADLFRRLDYKDYKAMASHYKSKHRGMEFYKIKDVQKYVSQITEAAYQFYYAEN